MARRFASSTEQEIEKLLKQKDAENKRRLPKNAKELFHEYLKEKGVQKLEDKKDTNCLPLFCLPVSVISLSPRLRLISVTSNLIIPDIAKTSSNNCL